MPNTIFFIYKEIYSLEEKIAKHYMWTILGTASSVAFSGITASGEYENLCIPRGKPVAYFARPSATRLLPQYTWVTVTAQYRLSISQIALMIICG
uniref:Uncharacterized protein n=1 Tax=Gossypium raimondii TaxID=29730 RepID=A0A0D2Q7R5_GOSRA|nr:hypothetical protein B456_002G169500 [Gossypium raimondii]